MLFFSPSEIWKEKLALYCSDRVGLLPPTQKENTYSTGRFSFWPPAVVSHTKSSDMNDWLFLSSQSDIIPYWCCFQFKSNTSVTEQRKPTEFISTAELSADLRFHIIKYTHIYPALTLYMHMSTRLVSLFTHCITDLNSWNAVCAVLYVFLMCYLTYELCPYVSIYRCSDVDKITMSATGLKANS